VQQLNVALENSKRRFVTINDPHIHEDMSYFVYSEGMTMQNETQDPANYTNVFVL